ncbi:MAG: carbamoyltransferase HypF [Chitinophagales bacterium]|nr:carbamoyltransferase HypF [Chitinophagales bacterium]
MDTWHIHIQGQVQGVGFRPFIYRLAKEHQLKGWVNNTIDGVHIELEADQSALDAFCEDVKNRAPKLARITQIQFYKTGQKFFDNFQIIHSEAKGAPNLLFSPDFALCKDCRVDIHNQENRRSNYAFTTCTNCGPRFSIINGLPYDREHTSMDTFHMCSTCQQEYDAPLNRRYYSQTNSCANCGVELILIDTEGQQLDASPDKLLKTVIEAWHEGAIVAIKGIGGYLLTCDATNEAAITRLRKRKQRPDKPLALMFPNLESIQRVAQIREEEVNVLNSSVSPIVLLDLKESISIPVAIDAIAPGLKQIGVMLPYAPLYELLLHRFGKPIVATSGNISRSPIIYKDDKAETELGHIADQRLSHNRAIVMPQDDNLIRYSGWNRQAVILRRSRGMAPTYINPGLKLPNEGVLAMGAMLKSTFTLLHQSQVYVSHYLGNLAYFDTQENYRHTVQHFLNLLKAAPAYILCDKHSDYPSTQLATSYAELWKIPLMKVQHHLAHFAAVLGENNLLSSKKSVLGVVWDGTGLGEDGQIWGGEFFIFSEGKFKRHSHFDYFPFILGDKMPREPRISALAASWEVEGAENLLVKQFSDAEWKIYQQLLRKQKSLQTSSVGRLFDAIAAILGIRSVQSFEGQAAMELQSLATQYFKKEGLDGAIDYFPKGKTTTLIRSIINDVKRGVPKEKIAANFHYTLVKMLERIANDLKITKLAFSGGVFQNSLLIDLLIHHLKAPFELYFHRDLSPNDECISFGQLMYYLAKKGSRNGEFNR